MKNIRLLLEYDGTNYHGWQSQKNALTIQDVLQKAVEELTGETCNIIGSGRTDAGVHALGQVANFVTNSKIPPEKFSYAINNILPRDIVVKKSEAVDMDFHARFSAIGKKYMYRIRNSAHPSALWRNREYHVRAPLDISSMNHALQYFIGEHDFAAFHASGGSVESTVRKIYDAGIKKEGECVILEIHGNGFLYNMVRIIAGTLVEVGMGKRKATDIPDILESKKREKAGRTAPPHGLYLAEVFYNDQKME
ncbi:MAG TPA: tRNA pseudouridine(38-40) synthase TruA [Clostridiaceae bacterium]|jgi:tRNA pseudouridine38-40 synthase|nr:tRNA pseudouridine(38-40) synthase TruA [Clostridiaceae bacterium]